MFSQTSHPLGPGTGLGARKILILKKDADFGGMGLKSHRLPEGTVFKPFKEA